MAGVFGSSEDMVNTMGSRWSQVKQMVPREVGGPRGTQVTQKTQVVPGEGGNFLGEGEVSRPQRAVTHNTRPGVASARRDVTGPISWCEEEEVT